MTNPFADFLYARGVWKANALRLNKQKPPQTVEKAVVTLWDRDLYKGTKGTDLPVAVSSNIARSKDGKLNIYYIDVFLDTSQIKRYPERELERSVFLAVLSQIYEDTARSTTTYEGRVSKREYVTKVADSPGAVPLTIKKLE